MVNATRVELAGELFGQGYNCAQAVLAAFGPDEGATRVTCLAVATPFGGGLGRMGEVCGAVSGALMVLGLRHGGDTVADPQIKDAAYAAAQEFIARFKQRHQTILCRELLGCDLGTPEGRAEAQARQLSQTLCPGFVRDAAEILEAMLG